MRLAKVIVKNFKCLEKVEITIPQTDKTRSGSADFVSIIGENNVGKSSVLEAIQLALPNGDVKLNENHFYHREEIPIEIILWFNKLNPIEAEHVQAYMSGEYIKLKVEYENKTSKGSYSVERMGFPKWNYTSSWPTFRGQGDVHTQLEQAYKDEHGNNSLTKAVHEEIQQLGVENDWLVPELYWHPFPKNGIPSEFKEQLPEIIYIPAVKKIDEETATGQRAAFGQLITNILETRTESHEEFRNALESLRQAEAQVANLFADGQYGIASDIAQKISERLSNFIALRAKVTFTPFKSVKDFNFANRTRLDIIDEERNDFSTSPEHQGHGAQRSLILTLLEMLAEVRIGTPTEDENPKETVILMEEPEIYMHPQMGRKMRDVLVDIARKPNAQVICTTHSPVFLDLADRHDGIVILHKNNGQTSVVQQEEDLFDDDERARLRMLLNFDAAVNEVFFCKHACLVEGDTELAAIEAYASRLFTKEIDEKEYWLARRDVTVINCRGKWTIAAFQKVLNWFKIPYVVVHDKDKEELEEGANERIQELAKANPILIHDKNFEEQIFKPEKEWKKDKPWKATQAINDGDIHDEEALKKFFLFALGKKSLNELKEKEVED